MSDELHKNILKSHNFEKGRDSKRRREGNRRERRGEKEKEENENKNNKEKEPRKMGLVFHSLGHSPNECNS